MPAFALPSAVRILAGECYKPAFEIEQMLAPHLTDDPVFGRMDHVGIADFFASAKLKRARDTIRATGGLVVVIGTGAKLVAETWNLPSSTGEQATR